MNKKKRTSRLLSNLCTGSWHARRAFSKAERAAVAEAVQRAEQLTSAQIKVVVESSLHFSDVIRGQTARERALEVFGLEQVWDTSENNGILLYLLISERDAEIIVDRGFNNLVTNEEWRGVCSILEQNVTTRGLGEATTQAVRAIGEIARKHFPPSHAVNELTDEVKVL